ncbi:hypothetical protein E4U53_007688, partial [Claviceps sorghi]
VDLAPGDFSRRLRDLGVARAKTTYPPSSTVQTQHENGVPTQDLLYSRHNTTLEVLQARQTLQQLAIDDALRLGPSDRGAKRFVDMRVAVDAIRMRHRGLSDAAIEKMLRLQPGSMSRVGSSGIISYIAQTLS